MVELRGIQKYFPANGVHALENADFTLLPGEIHALVGENGAGKSTLMHIMAGFIRPSAGSIYTDGTLVNFPGPAAALACGIGMVRQHPRLVPGFQVWEACILGSAGGAAGIIRKKKMRKMVQEVSDQWGFDLPADQGTDTLTVSQRQKCAILSLLLRNAEYLIFDEPTAVLTPLETERLFDLMGRLRSQGKGIVLISHKLEETLALADRVTVLRKGEVTATLRADTVSSEEISTLMFGTDRETRSDSTADFPAFLPEQPAMVHGENDGEHEQAPLLRVTGLTVEISKRPFIRSIDFEVPRGKIIGIAGVRDSGLETLELALTGFLNPSGGTVEVNGTRTDNKGPRTFRKAGAAYLSADRTGTALAMQLPLWDSLIVHAHRRAEMGLPGHFGIMKRSYLEAWVQHIMNRAQVSRSPRNPAESFSGGMLQRLVLAREFAEPVQLMVLAEPSWGLDTAGRELLITRIKKYAAGGKSVLAFSTDVEELIAMADEILVLRNGEIAARFLLGKQELRGPETDGASSGQGIRELIGQTMVGMGESSSAPEDQNRE
ncbi:ABC transporter ATP-binding protein [Breznakiella homolactica]|uniref:ATP-binding cassette domain-containing protein n=1 Tax=Breznakiella homolactica TaxID=2798577 RepID=A0A7T7XNE0_9SPIR|nr:ATP-binding cassette domain-containing protein [Breznakiella homolactica]QQO09521.1 ATP-binding cassette domain-containing protein [Breznakiella homolactica]